MKWSVMSTSSLSASAVARYYSLASRGSFILALRSCNRIDSIPFRYAFNACFMQWKFGASFGDTCARIKYHLQDPDFSKKLATFGPKLTMPSTCHPTSYLQITTSPSQCLLYTAVAQKAYPAP